MTDTELQRLCEQHLAWCQDWMDADREYGETPSYPNGWLPFGAFCGCDTCVVREILSVALEHLEKLAAAPG